MTPKEKAQELINKFIKPTIKWNPINDVGYYNDINAAKECALIAVDELTKYHNDLMDVVKQELVSNIVAVILYKYWDDVKQEIENL